jgi:soluble lytic murein transglycosylase-like protein
LTAICFVVALGVTAVCSSFARVQSDDAPEDSPTQELSAVTVLIDPDDAVLDAVESYTPTETAAPDPLYLVMDEVPMSAALQIITQQTCQEYGVPYSLVLAVIEAESSFNPDADNGQDIGLMQINSINFSWLSDLGIDPHTHTGNIEAGVLILSQHLDAYGDQNKALMAYNCGATGAANLWAEGYTSTAYSRSVVASAENWQSIIDQYT